MERGIVAVVGRPNVGKSTLFNYLIGQRLSIVDKTPGVTRDRVYADVEWLGQSFVMVDTGGIEPQTDDPLLQQMRQQSELAIDTADVILFMVDVRDGLHPADEAIAVMLRRANKPIVVGVNKVDNFGSVPPEFFDFYGLGFDDVHAISAEHALGLGELLDAIAAHLPTVVEERPDADVPRIALIGRPNSGKSSLLNRLSGQDRAIVTDIPGTTRDAIEERIEFEGKPYFIVDTAGMRRKSKVSDSLEYYSVLRGNRAIGKSDVAILLVDAAEGPSEQDTKIAGLALNRGKAIILCVNKWDLDEKAKETRDDFEAEMRRRFAFMPWAKLVFISALTGRGIQQLMATVDEVHEASQNRIRTAVLNDFIWEAQALQQPPSKKGKRLRIRYATQVSVGPPTFLFFVNDRKLMHYSYERYLENSLRRNFDFDGTPIRFILRQQAEKEIGAGKSSRRKTDVTEEYVSDEWDENDEDYPVDEFYLEDGWEPPDED